MSVLTPVPMEEMADSSKMLEAASIDIEADRHASTEKCWNNNQDLLSSGIVSLGQMSDIHPSAAQLTDGWDLRRAKEQPGEMESRGDASLPASQTIPLLEVGPEPVRLDGAPTINITERALKQLDKKSADKTNMSPKVAAVESKIRQERGKVGKRRAEKEKVSTPEVHVKAKQQQQQLQPLATEKSGVRRAKKSSSHGANDSQEARVGSRTTCSICGQEMGLGSKSVCKECLGRQKSEMSLTGTKISPSRGEGGHISASMEQIIEDTERKKISRTRSDLHRTVARCSSSNEVCLPELAHYWDEKTALTLEDGDEVPRVWSETICEESDSVEALCNGYMDTKKLSKGKDEEGNDTYTDSDTNYAGDKKAVKECDSDAEEEKAKSLTKTDLRRRLQRAMTDSEIVRAILGDEADKKGASAEKEMEQSVDTPKLPGPKTLKRKTSSQSMDTGRGVYKKDMKTKGEERGNEASRQQLKGKSHGYKSRTEGSTVATFRGPDKEKGMMGRRRSMENSSSSTSIGTTTKKSFGNLRSHTIIGGMHRNKDKDKDKDKDKEGQAKKDKKREETQGPGSEDGQAPNSNRQPPSETQNLEPLTKVTKSKTQAVPPPWYGSLGDSDESFEEKLKEDDSKPDKAVVSSKGKASPKEESRKKKEGDVKRSPSAVRKLGGDKLNQKADQRSSYPSSPPSSVAKSDRFDEGRAITFKDFSLAENSQTNEDNSRPFQGTQALQMIMEEDEDDDGGDDEDDGEDREEDESLASSAEPSPVVSSDDLYYNTPDSSAVVAATATVTATTGEGGARYLELPGAISADPTTPVYHASPTPGANQVADVEDKGAAGRVAIYHGQTVYDETDVDTGLTVLAVSRTGNSTEDSQVRVMSHLDAWGQPIASASNSSNDSDGKSEGRDDNWYTGGFFGDNGGEGDEDDESAYFDSGQSKDGGSASSDHDIYTGNVYSVPVASSGRENEGNKSFNNNKLEYDDESIVPNNNKTNSVRQQMHPPGHRRQRRRQQSREINTHDHCHMQEKVERDVAIWTEDQEDEEEKEGEEGASSSLDFHPCDLSNNYNGRESDCDTIGLPREVAAEESRGSRSVTSPTGSWYTEFDSTFRERSSVRVPELQQRSERGYTSFSGRPYEPPVRDFASTEFEAARSVQPFLRDVLFFGDDSNLNCAAEPNSVPTENPLYFANHSQYQGERSQNKVDYYATPGCSSPSNEVSNKSNNSNLNVKDANNADVGSNVNNNANCHDEGFEKEFEPWYTGCERNEEEFKPVFESEFNTAPNVWPLHQATTRVVNDNYFFLGSEEMKACFTEEDSDYACEPKVKDGCQLATPAIKQMFKVGGIVVRNNVQDDTDYAKNINMDLQEEPRIYVRYDMLEHPASEVSDTGSYEKNVVYDDFTTSRPWEDEERPPWRIMRGQNCGFNMEKALRGAYDIKKDSPHNAKNDENGRSWGLGSNIKAPGVVKYLGSYVTRWF